MSKFRNIIPIFLALLLLGACGEQTPSAPPSGAPETATPPTAGQGGYDVPGEEPEAVELVTDGLEGSYYNDYLGLTLTLDGAGGFLLRGGSENMSGTYLAAEDTLTLRSGERTETASIDLDGDVTIEGRTGYFLRDWAFWGITAAEAGPALSDTRTGVSDNGDGTSRYRDIENGVAFTYARGMEVLRGALVSAVAVTDGDGAYVTGRNVTELYFTNSGTDDEFLEDYIKAFVLGDFSVLYGDILSYDSLELLHEGIDGRLAAATLRLKCTEEDVAAKAILYTSTFADGTVNYIAKTVFAPATLANGTEVLSAAVTDMGAVRPVAD